MKILILGCGWIGIELAKLALVNKAEVWATTTQEEKCFQLQDLGIQAKVVDLDASVSTEGLDTEEFDVVVNSVPASKRMEIAALKARFNNVREFLGSISYRKHIYLSSIGIYPNQDGHFDETFDDDAALDEHLALAEGLMLALDQTQVYRLGGLFGKDRILAKYFENKVCTTGEQRANFVHYEDVVQLIWEGGTRELKSDIYNIVSPEHPTKQAVIESSAKRYGYQLPSEFEPTDSFQKIVLGDKIVRELEYVFLHPDPVDF